jgi:CheY-like chemotaxis protein
MIASNRAVTPKPASGCPLRLAAPGIRSSREESGCKTKVQYHDAKQLAFGSVVICVSYGEISVVDDDAATLEPVGRLLSPDRWETKTFSDAQELLRYSNAQQPLLAVIDVCTPAMNGFEVQSRLREISPTTRVIIFTGKESELDRVTAFRAGAVAFFNKPFDGDQFLSAVDAALRT